MNKQELKNLLYNRRFIAGGDYDKENPFVGIWLDDLVEIGNENMQCNIMQYNLKLVSDNKDIIIIPINNVKKLVPLKDKNDHPIIMIEYYDDEFCLNRSTICNHIEIYKKDDTKFSRSDDSMS